MLSTNEIYIMTAFKKIENKPYNKPLRVRGQRYTITQMQVVEKPSICFIFWSSCGLWPLKK